LLAIVRCAWRDSWKDRQIRYLAFHKEVEMKKIFFLAVLFAGFGLAISY